MRAARAYTQLFSRHRRGSRVPTRSLNLGILAHVDAGKTTLTERLLHLAGVIDEPGSVDSGTTRTDSSPSNAGAASPSRPPSWRSRSGTTVNVVDTPGHPDFIAEVERVLGVLDGAVLVLSAVEGVQPQTRILFRALQRLQRADTAVRQQDRPDGAVAGAVVAAVRTRLTPDVLAMGSVTAPGQPRRRLPAVRRQDRGFREREAAALAEHDDTLLAAYVEGRPASPSSCARRWRSRPEPASCTRCSPAPR